MVFCRLAIASCSKSFRSELFICLIAIMSVLYYHYSLIPFNDQNFCVTTQYSVNNLGALAIFPITVYNFVFETISP